MRPIASRQIETDALLGLNCCCRHRVYPTDKAPTQAKSKPPPSVAFCYHLDRRNAYVDLHPLTHLHTILIPTPTHKHSFPRTHQHIGDR